MTELVAVIASAALVGGLTAAVRRYLGARQVLDVPNGRSSHVTTTLRGGGLAVLVGLPVSYLALGLVPGYSSSLDVEVVVVLCAVVALGLLGWIEDVRGLSVRVRLAAQVVVGLGAGVSLMLAGAPLAVAGPLTLVTAFFVNAANFMDGVNGISAVHGILWGGYFALVAAELGAPSLTVLALCTAGAFLGFLPWNFPHARLFLGDVGSYILGGAVWGLALLTALAGAHMLIAVMPFLPYAADVVVTVVRRWAAGKNIAEAHREHAYQVVQQLSSSHVVSTLSAAGATAVVCSVGLLHVYGKVPLWGSMVLAVVVSVAYALVPQAVMRRDAARSR